jgi:methylenetetrahydrofolate reductase (NADPH)
MMHHGVDVPVIAGIMPVTDGRQIARICKLSGTTLPARFKAIVDTFSGNPAAMNQAGVAYATEQIIDLIANDVRHIHIYTMNKPDIAGRIMHNLSEIFR